MLGSYGVVVAQGEKVVGATFDHGALPDPIKEALENLQEKLETYQTVDDLPAQKPAADEQADTAESEAS